MTQSPCRDHDCRRRLIGLVVIVVLAYNAATQADGRKTSQADSELASAHNEARMSAARWLRRLRSRWLRLRDGRVAEDPGPGLKSGVSSLSDTKSGGSDGYRYA